MYVVLIEWQKLCSCPLVGRARSCGAVSRVLCFGSAPGPHTRPCPSKSCDVLGGALLCRSRHALCMALDIGRLAQLAIALKAILLEERSPARLPRPAPMRAATTIRRTARMLNALYTWLRRGPRISLHLFRRLPWLRRRRLSDTHISGVSCPRYDIVSSSSCATSRPACTNKFCFF